MLYKLEYLVGGAFLLLLVWLVNDHRVFYVTNPGYLGVVIKIN